ncbi:MAG: paraquat-inducible protein A [Methylococcaceae bacterium]|jgi:paraquat-inducible protein A
MTIKTARGQGLVRCHDCGQLSKIYLQPYCPLCGGHLQARKTLSLHKTLAFSLSGLILYIPANIFPIMTITNFGKSEPHTIIGGIMVLLNSGMVPIGLLVLIASILVPLLKLIGLALLMLCVYRQWQVNARLWTIIYRIICFVGRWSMLDIFMISILVSLVNLGGIAQVVAGTAASAFAAVVVLTIFAAKSFDPRLLWDNQPQ